MKKNRSEVKDVNDIESMRALVDSDGVAFILSKVKQRFFYIRLKLRTRALRFFRWVGIYDFLKYWYKKIR